MPWLLVLRHLPLGARGGQVCEEGEGSLEREARRLLHCSRYRRRPCTEKRRARVSLSSSLSSPRFTSKGHALEQPLLSLLPAFLSFVERETCLFSRCYSSLVPREDVLTSRTNNRYLDACGCMYTPAVTSSSHHLRRFFPSRCQPSSLPTGKRPHCKRQLTHRPTQFSLRSIPSISPPSANSSPPIASSSRVSSPSFFSSSSRRLLLVTPPAFQPRLPPSSSVSSTQSSFFSSSSFSEWRTEPILHLRGVGKVSRPLILPSSSSSFPRKENKRSRPPQTNQALLEEEEEQHRDCHGLPCYAHAFYGQSSEASLSRPRGVRFPSEEEEVSLSPRVEKEDFSVGEASGCRKTPVFSCASPGHVGKKVKSDVCLPFGSYTEKEIGAGAFVSSPFPEGRVLEGVMRYRSEDFIVREVDEEGRLSDVFLEREENHRTPQESFLKGLEEIDRRRARLMEALQNYRKEVQRSKSMRHPPSQPTSLLTTASSSSPPPPPSSPLNPPCCCSSSSSRAQKDVHENGDEPLDTFEALVREAELLSSIKFVLVKLNRETPGEGGLKEEEKKRRGKCSSKPLRIVGQGEGNKLYNRCYTSAV